MVALCNMYYEKEPSDTNIYNGKTMDDAGAFNMENIAAVALLHDICKANCYVKDFKNVKVEGNGRNKNIGNGKNNLFMGTVQSLFIFCNNL